MGALFSLLALGISLSSSPCSKAEIGGHTSDVNTYTPGGLPWRLTGTFTAAQGSFDILGGILYLLVYATFPRHHPFKG